MVHYGVELVLLVSMLFLLAIPKTLSILKEILYTSYLTLFYIKVIIKFILHKYYSVLFRFKGCNPETKMKLFNAYCLSLYGCALWRLDAPDTSCVV